jgi:hypothetical protein
MCHPGGELKSTERKSLNINNKTLQTEEPSHDNNIDTHADDYNFETRQKLQTRHFGELLPKKRTGQASDRLNQIIKQMNRAMTKFLTHTHDYNSRHVKHAVSLLASSI